MTLSPRVQVAVAALLFSTGGVAIKANAFTGWQVASLRSGIAACTLLLVLPAARRGMTWRAAMVGVTYACTLVSFVLANKLTTSANAIYLQSTAPLYLLLLGPFLLRERISRRDIPVVVAVIAGLALVFMGADLPSGTASDPARGNMIALISGLSYALMLCGLRWLGRDGDSRMEGIAAVVLGNAFACVLALPMALPLGHISLIDGGVVLYLGVFQIGLAYLLVTRGLQQVRAIEVSVLLLIETAFNPIWSWLFLGEVPTVFAILGGAIIVVATLTQAIRAPRAAAAVTG
ncbi:MAG: EamA family transporter [Gemmatimonadales bacterium]